MIPCFVIMRDLLTLPLQMLPDIERLGMRPVLRDQGSTYPPLLEYYKTTKYEVNFVGNGGSQFIFSDPSVKMDGWYVVTDCDLDLSSIPDDFVQVAQIAFNLNPQVSKAAVSLRIDDIPKDVLLLDTITAYESKYWKYRTPSGHWIANTETTFALYHSDRALTNFYSSVRLDIPYTARHLPWYVSNQDQIDEETRYYLKRIDNTPHYGNKYKTLLRM